MKTFRNITAGLIAVTLSMVALVASPQKGKDNDRDRANRFSARLLGINEVPSVSTGATGSLKATISKDEQSIEYELTFTGLQSPVTQSHIHIAQPDVNGGIVIWFCQTAAALDPVNTATQQCPVNGGTIVGTIRPSDIRVQAAQGLPTALSASDKFDRVVAAIRSGNAYANVHTAQSPGGEIRGQIQVGGGHKGDHD